MILVVSLINRAPLPRFSYLRLLIYGSFASCVALQPAATSPKTLDAVFCARLLVIFCSKSVVLDTVLRSLLLQDFWR